MCSGFSEVIGFWKMKLILLFCIVCRLCFVVLISLCLVYLIEFCNLVVLFSRFIVDSVVIDLFELDLFISVMVFFLLIIKLMFLIVVVILVFEWKLM